MVDHNIIESFYGQTKIEIKKLNNTSLLVNNWSIFILCYSKNVSNLKVASKFVTFDDHYYKSREEGKDQELIQGIDTIKYHTWPATPYRKVAKTRKHNTQESQEVSPYPAGDHKAARNRQDSKTKTNMKNK